MELPVRRHLVEEILQAMRTVEAAGLLPLTQGNMSVRDRATGLIAITPHDVAYDRLDVTDMVALDLEGKIVWGEREPSSDAIVHRAIYRARSDVNAVLHTEPPHVNAIGVTGENMQPLTTLGLKSLREPLQVMPFRAVRDEAFALDMLACMGADSAVVWRNHGLLVCGVSADDVVRRSIGIEYNAQVLCLARASGLPVQTIRYGDDGAVEVGNGPPEVLLAGGETAR